MIKTPSMDARSTSHCRHILNPATHSLTLPSLTFEILDGLHFQLQGGILVAHKHGAGVLLEGGHGPHVVHSLLDGFVQSEGLVSACDEDHHLGAREQARDGGGGAASLEVQAPELGVWPPQVVGRSTLFYANASHSHAMHAVLRAPPVLSHK